MIVVWARGSLRGGVCETVTSLQIEEHGKSVMSAGRLRIPGPALISIITAMVDESRNGFIPGCGLCDRVYRRVEIASTLSFERAHCVVGCEPLVIPRADIGVIFLACIAHHSDAEIVAATLREITCFITISACAVVQQCHTTGLQSAKTHRG